MSTPLLALAFALTAAGDPCDLPASFTHSITSQPADVEFTLALDKSVYVQGETAHFYYRVKNLGAVSKYWGWGEDPMNCFAVYPGGCTTLAQAGCFENYAFFYPEMIYFYSQGFTLAPGECRVFTRTWDLRSPDWNLGELVPTPPGHYQLLAGLWRAIPDWPGMFVDDSGLSLDIEIQFGPIPVRATTWGAVKALYR